MSLESVLSEILGVPCGNVKFTREGYSQEFFNFDEYVHGITQYHLEFTTKKPLVDLEVGSIVSCKFENNRYLAVLLKGKETDSIVRAIVDELW